MIIVLEGLEGVGKTTLAKSAANKLGCDYIKTPPEEFSPLRGYISNINDPNTNFYFYLSSIFAIQKRLNEVKFKKNMVIIDRYILSTIAYFAAGKHFEAPPFEEKDIIKPDLTINVHCSDETRMNRKIARGFHIYERPSIDENNIKKFFSDNIDDNFNNEAQIEHSTNALCELICGRLSE